MTENPELYKDKLTAFYRTDVSEKEKAENFLDLIIENPEDRQIYMDRWESVKQADVFQNNDKKSFAQNRFKREQFKEIVMRTPSDLVRSAYTHIKEMLSRTNDKGDIVYDR